MGARTTGVSIWTTSSRRETRVSAVESGPLRHSRRSARAPGTGCPAAWCDRTAPRGNCVLISCPASGACGTRNASAPCPRWRSRSARCRPGRRWRTRRTAGTEVLIELCHHATRPRCAAPCPGASSPDAPAWRRRTASPNHSGRRPRRLRSRCSLAKSSASSATWVRLGLVSASGAVPVITLDGGRRPGWSSSRAVRSIARSRIIGNALSKRAQLEVRHLGKARRCWRQAGVLASGPWGFPRTRKPAPTHALTTIRLKTIGSPPWFDDLVESIEQLKDAHLGLSVVDDEAELTLGARTRLAPDIHALHRQSLTCRSISENSRARCDGHGIPIGAGLPGRDGVPIGVVAAGLPRERRTRYGSGHRPTRGGPGRRGS